MDEQTSFFKERYKQTFSSHIYVLEEYFKKAEEMNTLSGNAPIFLDTNVILKYYEISFKARNKLEKYFRQLKDRLVVSNKVQFEVIKNRENVIQQFKKELNTNLPDAFKSINGKLENFLNQNKVRLVDYSDLHRRLKNLHIETSKIFEEIKFEIKELAVKHPKSLEVDSYFNLINNLILLEPLQNKYVESLKDEFEKMSKTLKPSDIENSTINVFPGCAERTEKDDPTSDYIIFHEMMNYSIKNKCDIIFLTYDNAKGDWFGKGTKQQHLHYCEIFYLNTGQFIFIVNAEKYLNEHLQVDMQSLINSNLIDDELLIELSKEKQLSVLEAIEHLSKCHVDISSTSKFEQKIRLLIVGYFISKLYNKEDIIQMGRQEEIKIMVHARKDFPHEFDHHGEFFLLNSINKNVLLIKNTLVNRGWTGLELLFQEKE